MPRKAPVTILWALWAGWLLSGPLAADTLFPLDDGEGKIGPWRNTQRVSEPVHGGKWALKWDVAAHPGLDSPRFMADWTPFDELRFWAYLDAPVDFIVPI
ncbi:MAG: hypothetical protein FJ278_11200, partial [Planctomycetes bacterium]|nr:hypothetical protein [Planctomycetota bacterium]